MDDYALEIALKDATMFSEVKILDQLDVS